MSTYFHQKFEWNFKYITKNTNVHLSLSIIIYVKFNRNYIIYNAVLPITERTLYYYQEKGYLSCKNIDLPRIVRYRKRKRNVSKNKSERKENECRINRTYQDFIKYKEANKIIYYVEMDKVESVKEHSALLTLNFVPFNFMLAYKLKT